MLLAYIALGPKSQLYLTTSSFKTILLIDFLRFSNYQYYCLHLHTIFRIFVFYYSGILFPLGCLVHTNLGLLFPFSSKSYEKDLLRIVVNQKKNYPSFLFYHLIKNNLAVILFFYTGTWFGGNHEDVHTCQD